MNTNYTSVTGLEVREKILGRMVAQWLALLTKEGEKRLAGKVSGADTYLHHPL